MTHSPYIRQSTSVQRVMLKVLLALLPGIAVYCWQIGTGILLSLLLASVVAIAAEAGVLALRQRPVTPAVSDLSAVVTAWLIVLSFPPTVPAWLLILAVLIAIVAAKHLYGGLGQNPFNPAMAAYCTMIVAYPALMSSWPDPTQGAGLLDLATQFNILLGHRDALDGITGATVLDALRTGLREAGATVSAVSQNSRFGYFGGTGWEWIGLAYLIGGGYLLASRIITWHMPVAFLGCLTAVALIGWLAHPAQFASPLFHLTSGGTLLAAFFIVTDPVSGATTPRGKLIFAAGVALIAWLIRTFGAYPEGIAFGVLLMNLCVPLIDMKTQPPVFGHARSNRP